MLTMTIYILLFAIFALLIRLVLGPTVWERLMAMNLIVIKLMLIITVVGVLSGVEFLLDVALTYGIIGFVAMIIISRFVLRGGRLK